MTVFDTLRRGTLKYASAFVGIDGCRSNLLEKCLHRHVLPVLWRKNIHLEPKSAPWSVLFFGTDEFALQSLRKLHEEYRLKRLLCRLEVMTAYKGRENAVMKFAREHGLPINDWPLKINTAEFHIGLVVSFGHLIPTDVIQSFPLGMLNVHASLLPRWRGAAPIIYSIMNGDTRTGVTIMNVKPKKFDVGEIVVQQETDVDPEERLPQLQARLAAMGADLLLDTVEKLPGVLALVKPQTDEGVTYAPKINSKLSLVKWGEMTARNVYDLQRALQGLYTLTTKFNDATIKLIGVKIYTDPSETEKPVQKIPGLVQYDKVNKILIVQCRDGSWVSVSEIGLPGRPPMSARDFNNGFIANHGKKCFFQ